MQDDQKKVFIVRSNPFGDHQYDEMFEADGWEIVEDPLEATLIQFTGGADVSPDLYGCGVHPTTMSDPHRDAREHDIFELAQEHSIPCAGICRGAQFLNVKCGGRMFQHVDNHAIGGTHSAIDVGTALTVEVTSTHHQMMIPDEDYAMYILTVPQSRCSHKDYVDADGELQIVTPKAANRSDQDIEAVFYPDQRVFCFQPHPEYAAGEACREYYFAQIESLLFFDNTRRNNWSVNHDEGQSNNVKISDSLDDLLVAAVDPEEED